jgi:hypothetical protein
MRLLSIAVALGAVVWLAFCRLMYNKMRRRPAQFAAFMAKLPGLVFLVLPFKTMWNRARGGVLKLGDQAPDFRLQTLDRKSEVSLGSFRNQRPVVLIFGSFT